MQTMKLIALTLMTIVLSTMIVAEANAKTVLRKIEVDLVTPTTEAMAIETNTGDFIPMDMITTKMNKRGNAWDLMNSQVIELKTGDSIRPSHINYFYAKMKSKALGSTNIVNKMITVQRAPKDDE